MHDPPRNFEPGERRQPPIRVLCVDDSPDVLQSLRITLAPEKDILCVGFLDSADRLIEEVELHAPDVVLLDLTMPGKDPLAATAELSAQSRNTRVLAFSGFDDADRFDAVFAAGGWGLLSKDSTGAAIAAAIRQVASGQVVIPGR